MRAALAFVGEKGALAKAYRRFVLAH